MHPFCRRCVWPTLAVMLCGTACNDPIVASIVALSPVPIPFLSDAGPASLVTANGVDFDAAGFFAETQDGGVATVDQACGPALPCSAADGLECVPDRLGNTTCQPRCTNGEACPDGRYCADTPTGGRHCVPVSNGGGPCERETCNPDAGLTCLPARVEGGRTLALTCQRACDPAGAACEDQRRCLPTAGTFPCDGGGCPPVQHACATEAPQGNPTLLGTPAAWPAGSTCDPGVGQRLCPATLGDAPLWCAQGNSLPRTALGGRQLPGVDGLCVAVCQDPVNGTSHSCPAGQTCNTRVGGLVHVPDADATCAATVECDVGAGQFCAGPLAAFGLGYRCALPFGLCVPPPPPTDGGVLDGGLRDGG